MVILETTVAYLMLLDNVEVDFSEFSALLWRECIVADHLSDCKCCPSMHTQRCAVVIFRCRFITFFLR